MVIPSNAPHPLQYFLFPNDSKVLWKCAPVHPVVLRLPEQSRVHEAGFAVAVGHKLGPKLLEALAEAHGKQSHGCKHIQNGSKWLKHVQRCSIFFASFPQCLNLVERCGKWAQSGQHRDNRMPENARLHHVTPPPTMQNFGAAISLRQLHNARVHECFGTVIS